MRSAAEKATRAEHHTLLGRKFFIASEPMIRGENFQRLDCNLAVNTMARMASGRRRKEADFCASHE